VRAVMMGLTEFAAVTTGTSGKTHFYVGPPPRYGEPDRRTPGPPTDVVVIAIEDDGVFLLHYTCAGVFVGDTWHRSVDEANEQARYEFGPALLPFEPVTPGESLLDVIARCCGNRSDAAQAPITQT
jgi:hypothetical protein